jgi:glycine betaine/proline transport system permease protein
MSTAEPSTEAIGARIGRFVDRSESYYTRQFGRIFDATRPILTFNTAAAFFGPLWCGARGLWGLFALAVLADVVALIQIGRGWLSQGASAGVTYASQLRAAAEERAAWAADLARTGDAEAAATFSRIARNLTTAADQALATAQHPAASGSHAVLLGLGLFVVMRLTVGLLANYQYERQYWAWRSDPTIASGLDLRRLLLSALLLLAIYPLTVYRFVVEQVPAMLLRVPVDKTLFTAVAGRIDALFDGLYHVGSGFFDSIRDAIRMLVGVFETILLVTPWPVVMLLIIAIAWRLAGVRVALFTTAAIAYLALLGLWEQSMQTVALLGTAALVGVALGIPLGIWFARTRRAYAVARPILDLMQTMPAVVYLIPAIAFFGTGTPPGIIATLVFGMPPVIRMTTLGIQQVPSEIKEAARAFGASGWQLLVGVELPLAMPSIMAGVTQTILMCLSMVVIAALIGAQGLGSTVLEALQFAATGQGILAGVAILLCAIVIDRIVQGAFGARDDSDERH